MRLTDALLLLLLTGTLAAQSKITPPKKSPFPPEITQVIVIFQENRTPDNLFHFLSPLCPIPTGARGVRACTPSPVTSRCYDVSPCGLSNQSGDVVPITLTPIRLAGSTDPDHTHTAFAQMCDADPANTYRCRNDGAWQIRNNPGTTSYAYVDNPAVVNSDGSAGRLLDPLLTFAERYGWANFMYQTNQGPSYPAHQIIFSGTSARSSAEDKASTFISENFSSGDAGCLAPAAATTTLLSPILGNLGPGCTAFDNNSVQECPLTNTALSFPHHPVGSFCHTKPTMGSLLDAKKLSWKYYAPSAGSIWTAPNSIRKLCAPQFTSPTTLECSGAEWNANVDVASKGTDILRDITNCNLSNVSWVIPNGIWSDHAGPNSVRTNYGPSWVAAIVNAVGQNPVCPEGTTNAGQIFWRNTAIIITWDDWGGWSDNQPAFIRRRSGSRCTSTVCQSDDQYGFRVPLIVVSAYTRPGYINNVPHDFGSILRMIEGIYRIPEGKLGVADARALSDLRGFFTGKFRPYTPVPALVDASYFLGQDAQKGASTAPDNDGDDD